MSHDIINLCGLANKAKSVGYYEVADAIFVFLTELFFGSPDHSGLKVWIETSDSSGKLGPQKAHYDLVVIGMRKIKGVSLSIPTPRLNSSTVAAYYKHVATGPNFVPRQEHSRMVVGVSTPQSRHSFNREYYDLVGGNVEEDKFTHTFRHLSGDAFDKVCKALTEEPPEKPFNNLVHMWQKTPQL